MNKSAENKSVDIVEEAHRVRKSDAGVGTGMLIGESDYLARK